MSHDPQWHILDNSFTERNDGLATPTRNLGGLGSDETNVSRTWQEILFPYLNANYNRIAFSRFGLRIGNLDRDDPPGYQRNGVPRGTFNRNVLAITAIPRMPTIAVKCQVRNFDPATTAIEWRLQCRHVLGRYVNTGNYRYKSTCTVLGDEWQGQSRSAEFTLFQDPEDPNVSYTHNSAGPSAPVMGGHAILTVVARPNGAPMLLDYVHIRIGGTNPGRDQVNEYIRTALSDRDENIIRIVGAIFAHEAHYAQFLASQQTFRSMTFGPKQHGRPDAHHPENTPRLPKCKVKFDFPDDPEHFPYASYDCGVGISQYTHVAGQLMSNEVAWDWRANINIGINTLFDKLRATRRKSSTWREWAMAGWKGYNGSGAGAVAYAEARQASAEGLLVSSTELPESAANEVRAITLSGPRPDPPAWPPARNQG